MPNEHALVSRSSPLSWNHRRRWSCVLNSWIPRPALSKRFRTFARGLTYGLNSALFASRYSLFASSMRDRNVCSGDFDCGNAVCSKARSTTIELSACRNLNASRLSGHTLRHTVELGVLTPCRSPPTITLRYNIAIPDACRLRQTRCDCRCGGRRWRGWRRRWFRACSCRAVRTSLSMWQR